MPDQYSRTRLLLGSDGVDKLRSAHVALFGLGGVGGYAAEALARAGVGHMDLIDDDTVSLTNLNRQMLALHSTVGRPKTEVMAERIADINPNCTVHTANVFYLPENADQYDLSAFDDIRLVGPETRAAFSHSQFRKARPHINTIDPAPNDREFAVVGSDFDPQIHVSHAGGFDNRAALH